MEGISEIKLGSSLPVPLVQELAKEITTIDAVPQRYLRPDLHQDSLFNTINNTSSSSQLLIPVIHFNNLLSSDKFLMESELQKLHLASKDWGFFQLVDHGVSPLVVEDVKSRIKEFFDMPMEEKNKFRQQSGELEGLGQAFVVSEEQKLDWADMFFVVTQPKHLRKPHLLPNLPLPFRETLEAYSTELEKITMKLLDFMGKALGMEPNEMSELLGEGWQSMRMNYYPPCPQPELVIGVNPHSDTSGLTIILQINEMDGLQIKKDGIWIPVRPLPNAFIINIGDSIEILTNGIYRSIEHRATVNPEKERLSIATFYSPNLNGDLGPAPSLVTPKTPAKFKKIRVMDFFRGYLARKLDGKSYVDSMRITPQEEGQGDLV
ncbi:codeine O-demethylase-like [Humulus lupulus]|uniref:codeine O-demethylase-like n=1 Tax=Humulus lupulus TaxID=3486 RepID=UPI002B401B15|nr:codeine O-demethylase-like [Humulus lupulus]